MKKHRYGAHFSKKNIPKIVSLAKTRPSKGFSQGLRALQSPGKSMLSFAVLLLPTGLRGLGFLLDSIPNVHPWI